MSRSSINSDAWDGGGHASYSLSSPPSPRHEGRTSPYASSTRRSSVCVSSTTVLYNSAFQASSITSNHRRSRSFREGSRRNDNSQPNHWFSNRSIVVPNKQASLSQKPAPPQDVGTTTSKRLSKRPPPLNCFGGNASSCSSAGSTCTTGFNTSTESAPSAPQTGTGSRYQGHHGYYRMVGSPSAGSVGSVSSEYSTTSSMSKRETTARIAAAGGKLAYLASRRGSSGSVCSSGCSTPPNTPGGGGAGARGRRQSSGNFLEVPNAEAQQTQQQQQPIVSPRGTSGTASSSSSTVVSRPRVNSLPATSLLNNPQLLSPTYIPGLPAYYQHHVSMGTPYNPRSNLAKSQDYLYRLRTFNITKGGDVVNCGDTIQVRRSKSNNCIHDTQGPTGGSTSPNNASQQNRKCSLSTSPNRSPRSSPCRRGSLSPRLMIMTPLLDASGCCVAKEMGVGSGSDEDEFEFGDQDDDEDDVEDEEELTMRELVRSSGVGGGGGIPGEGMKYRVVMLGESGVGKSALVRQFMTSEYINTYDMSLDEEYGEREVCVLLDSKQSDLVFIDHPFVEMSVENSLATYEPHACIVVYSVTDRRSFDFAGDVLRYLWQEGTTHSRSVILVGNKSDLARARVVSTHEGKQLATSHDSKFIETSSGIQHNVDELLVGVLKQIRLRQAANTDGVEASRFERKSHHHVHHRRGGGTTPRGSIMGLLFTRELINKLCFLSNKAKSCENLHVL